MKEYTFRLYDNFLPNPNVIKPGNIIANFKYCNISELSWVDEEFTDNVFILPDWIVYFDLSYNSIYAFFKGSSHDYQLPKNLQALNLSFNKLDFMPDNVPKGLVALNISNNTIKYIAQLPQSVKIVNASHNTIKWFDQELENLEKLNLSHNRLIYFRFDRLKEHIKFLDLSGNQLKEISGNVFPPNLEILKLKENRIKVLPELPKNLIELDVSDNKLTEINFFPETLKSLDVSSNQLEHLSNSLLACQDLEKLNYEKNETIEISLELLMWIDNQFHKMHSNKKDINLKELYAQNYEEIQTIYKDSQNAHNLKIRNDIQESMERIVINDAKPEINFTDSINELNKYFKQEETAEILEKSDFGNLILNGQEYTLATFFPYLYNRIMRLENPEGLAMILENEIHNSKSVCFSGRIEAYVSAFASFFDDVRYSPSVDDQILAKIEQIKNKLHKDRIPADSLNYQVEMRFYMEEMLRDTFNEQEKVMAWLSPIDEYIEELIMNLEAHYKKDIREVVNIIKMRKVIKQYFLQTFCKDCVKKEIN